MMSSRDLGVLFGLLCWLPVQVAAAAEAVEASATAQATIADSAEASESSTDGTGPEPGHSYHGEAFNEGPRQRAVLIGGTGKVVFPITTSVEEARAFFEQGVGQLHGFWYLEAERSFRQAAALDPECAMAYWGIAWANINNEKRAKEIIAKADAFKAKVSDRERSYIETAKAYFDAGENKKKERGLAYIKALEQLIDKHPDDHEAKALLALHLWLERDRTPIASHLAVDAILDQVFAAEPMHPAHHFRIHLWDKERAEKALESAALCGQSAPSIAHMWHMPGHIYSNLKRYHDAAWQQEASARVDHAHMLRTGVLPDEIHNFAHNNEWLIRNLNFIGRSDDAVALAKNMISLPRHPKYNVPDKRATAHFGRLRLLETLDRYERFEELIALCDTGYLGTDDDVARDAVRLRYLGEALWRSNKHSQAEALLSDLRQRLDKAKVAAYDAQHSSPGSAGKKEAKSSPADSDKEKEKVAKAATDAVKELDRTLAHVEVWQLAAKEDYAGALERLKTTDGVDPLDQATLRLKAGAKDEAIAEIQKQVEAHENEVVPAAKLVEILWHAGKKEETLKAFETLRGLAATASLNDPPLARLAPIAQELGLPTDWRQPREEASDVGDRPPLDTLGPLFWRPANAPAWTLTDANGEQRSFEDYRGRPVVLLFFLGNTCLHCAKQLQMFADQKAEFDAAGIELIGISTDPPEKLGLSVEDYSDDGFPLPLVSNADLSTFKIYGCHDDFESQPLHGTILIDAGGRIRWRDIGPEPFEDPKFLVEEAQRLFAIDRATSTTAPTEVSASQIK